MPRDAVEHSTGNLILDASLGGGFQAGSTVLLAAEEGAGGTELALLMARRTRAEGRRAARWVTALRSAPRVEREARLLFADEKAAERLEIRPYRNEGKTATHLLEGLAAGTLLVLESAETLDANLHEQTLVHAWRELGNAANELGVLVILLHTPGTIASSTEGLLAQSADAVLRFRWHEGGATRRRTLVIEKLRGLAPGLGAEESPIFEVALEQGRGFSIARDRSIL